MPRRQQDEAVEKKRATEQEQESQRRAKEVERVEKIKKEERERQEKFDQEKKIALKKREEARPDCMSIRFTGLATGDPWSLSVAVKSTEKATLEQLEDYFARNPLLCSATVYGPSCKGVQFFELQNGIIIDWSNEYYKIISPVDLTVGRKDLVLYIRRIGVACMDSQQPSLDHDDNVKAFLTGRATYR